MDWFPWFVLIAKFFTFICSFGGAIFIGAQAVKRYNKAWSFWVVFLLSWIVFMFAIFWNYADHPMRAWNPMYSHEEESD